MTEKDKKIILSVAGGLVTIVIGYLVWRHEQSISSAQSQQTLQAEQDTATQLEADLQNATMNVSGGQATEQSYVPQQGDSGIQSIPQDTNLEAILQAFFGTQSGGSSITGTGSSSTSTGASGGTDTQPGGGGGFEITRAPGSGAGSPSPILNNGSGVVNPQPVIPGGGGVKPVGPAPVMWHNGGVGIQQ